MRPDQPLQRGDHGQLDARRLPVGLLLLLVRVRDVGRVLGLVVAVVVLSGAVEAGGLWGDGKGSRLQKCKEAFFVALKGIPKICTMFTVLYYHLLGT